MVETDHDALIRRAGGDCDCDHSWTSGGGGEHDKVTCHQPRLWCSECQREECER